MASIQRALLSKPVVIACRLLLAAVFIYAAVGKIREPEEFAVLVNGYRILPLWAVNLVAIILPWLELLCAVSLLTGILCKNSALILAVTNLVFFAMVASALARGLDIECGCFTLSKAHSKVGWSHLIIDLSLFFACLPILFSPSKNAELSKTACRARTILNLDSNSAA